MTFEQWFSNQVFKDEYTTKDLQEAYEAGQKEMEELIDSILAENKEIYKKMADLDTALEDCTESLTDARIKIKELEEENTKLKAYNEKLLNGDIEKHNKIVELQAQIEKMKLCQNCKFENNDFLEKPCCDCSRCLGDIKRKGNSDKWELQED